MNKFEIIARWIHSESTEPISEIEWLLIEKYNADESLLLEDYDDVIKEEEWWLENQIMRKWGIN